MVSGPLSGDEVRKPYRNDMYMYMRINDETWWFPHHLGGKYAGTTLAS